MSLSDRKNITTCCEERKEVQCNAIERGGMGWDEVGQDRIEIKPEVLTNSLY